MLAESALQDGVVITGYAYARTGYHRGLDQLRRNGWKGFGPVPWAHVPNQGFLRALGALHRAAATIDIAHDLGLWVTAEGVEAPADLDCVRELGCDGAFGFLLLSPCPAREIGQHLDQPLAVRWDRVDAL